jgi:hypothetical protein
MTATREEIRLVPKMDTRDAIMSDIAHEWNNVCGPSATVAHVAAKWRLDRNTCGQLLAELADRGVLVQLADGSYRHAALDWRGDDF